MMTGSYTATFWDHSHFPSAKKEHLALNYIKSAYWERCNSRPAGNTWSQLHKWTSMQPSKSSGIELSENSPNMEEMLASMELVLMSCLKSLCSSSSQGVIQ